MNVSVIIRNRNEREFIGFAIQSVIDYIPNAQIIIIDNNSTDNSLDIVRLFNNRCNIEIVNITDYTPGKSLNTAVKLCKHDCILVLSAHAQITKLNLNLIQTKLKNNAAIFGNQTPIYLGKRINKRYIWSHFADDEITNMFSQIENRPFLHNAFCFYNKQDLIELPFDETLPGKEDRYWAIKAIKQHKTYLYLPNIEVNHFYTTNGATWKGIG
jgi:glycosyltransferase involved in cell wall biosynthesis